MELAAKVAVVTGGASGIGRALCRRFAAEGASVVVADVDAPGAAAVAQEIKGLAVPCDVSVEADVLALIDAARLSFDRIDLFCANAGIANGGQPDGPGAGIGPEAPDEDWERMWRVNVFSHIYAARALVPVMLDQGGGHILVTASAAGLLTVLGNAPYSVTKHAAVAFAEWLAITYGDQGIKVSCLCPQAIRTNLGATSRKQTGEAEPPPEVSQGSAFWQAAVDGVLTADQAAQTILEGLADERFLILPHPEVAVYEQRRAQDRDRWLRGMRRFRARLFSTPPPGGEQGA